MEYVSRQTDRSRGFSSHLPLVVSINLLLGCRSRIDLAYERSPHAPTGAISLPLAWLLVPRRRVLVLSKVRGILQV